MATLSESIAEIRRANGVKRPQPAGRTETILPEAYLEECDGKPQGAIVVGLRTPNDEDYARAKACESDYDAMVCIVAAGLCDPNDCTRAHPSFPLPDVQIRGHLKPGTVRYLFDRIEALHIETSPAVPLATDEELFLLGDALQCGERLDAIEAENLPRSARIRRLATALIEALGVET